MIGCSKAYIDALEFETVNKMAARVFLFDGEENAFPRALQGFRGHEDWRGTA